MKATARANTNIALIKYWGKRDEELFLPTNSSLSLTLDGFYTTTTVEFSKELINDELIINGVRSSDKELLRVSRFLNIVRRIAEVDTYASVISENNVPIAAGFASSASAFAALAAASTKSLGLELSKDELSILARQGSGSACRSIYGGFVEWKMGKRDDGKDSKGKQLLSEDKWGLTVLSAVVSSERKKVSSSEGMKRTVETSPFYKGWLDTVHDDLLDIKAAIKKRDFIYLGEVMERNALKMHGTMLGARPPILYWESGTIEVISCVYKLRNSGIPAFFTIDAGANVKVLCLPEEEYKVREALMEQKGVERVITCHPGRGITYL
ncbi:diphosphomevalonate decarboxylase [Alloiococcus sp. CFN-8]|uniref:diphosphomevalonate decarboxylase n=1 Tax=Alloiococcus sp. CFN-8 TaxID=3416081 RepID=UPI003CF0C3A1